MSDDARKAILARRARFIAAALASASLTGSCAKPQHEPEVCLSMRQPDPDGDVPQPCLSPVPIDADAGPPPTPCLEPPPPQVCLSQPMPADDPPGDFAKPPPGK